MEIKGALWCAFFIFVPIITRPVFHLFLAIIGVILQLHDKFNVRLIVFHKGVLNAAPAGASFQT